MDKASSKNVRERVKSLGESALDTAGDLSPAQEYAHHRQTAREIGKTVKPSLKSIHVGQKAKALAQGLVKSAAMDRELAQAVLERWAEGLPVPELTLYKAASVVGVDPSAALVEARYCTYLDSYLMEKQAREMTSEERIVFSACAGLDPFCIEKVADEHGFLPEELILAALKERHFVPAIEKLAELHYSMQKVANLSGIGGDPTVAGAAGGGDGTGQGPPDMSDPQQQQAMQQALGIMGQQPQQGAMVQQQPQARGFKPSPTAPEQMPADPNGNLQGLLQDQSAMYGQGAQENGGLPPSGMPEPPPEPMSSVERVQQVGPNLDQETAQRYAEQLDRFEQGINMQVSDPKQMVKFVEALQKVDGKRIDQGIKAMSQQLEQEQAAELGVDGGAGGQPTIKGPGGAGPGGAGGPLAPKKDAQSGGGGPSGQPGGGGSSPDDAVLEQAFGASGGGGGGAGGGGGEGGGPPQGQKPPQKKPQPQQRPQPEAAAAEKVAHVGRLLAHFTP